MQGVEIMCEECSESMTPTLAMDGIHWICPKCKLEVNVNVVREAGEERGPYAGYNPSSWQNGTL
jgi:Zn finger protein HypA/HybF involved in hydrogenase expression